MTRLIARLFPFADREHHPVAAGGHPARSRSRVQADRDRLIGLFVD
jgi:hypothetical protein